MPNVLAARILPHVSAGVALLIALALIAAPRLQSADGQPDGVAAHSVASCESVAMFEEPLAPTDSDRVVMDRIAVPAKHFRGPPVRLRTGSGLRYWAKAGLLVRPGTAPVDVIVPAAWRSRLATEWGDSAAASVIRIRGCKSAERWLVYTGGFYLRRPACVPLVIKVGTRKAHLRFAIGRDCSEG